MEAGFTLYLNILGITQMCILMPPILHDIIANENQNRDSKVSFSDSHIKWPRPFILAVKGTGFEGFPKWVGSAGGLKIV